MKPKHSSFRFETERLKAGPQTHEIDEAPETLELVDDPEYTFPGRVRGRLTLALAGTDTVRVSGHVEVGISGPCVRCLEPMPHTLRARVELVYVQDDRLLDPVKHPEFLDDDTAWYDGEAIYPAERLREALLLELPAIYSCTLEAGDRCPVRKTVVKLPTFGSAEEAPAVDDSESFAGKLRRMRREASDGKG